jgi:ankyrin repeat protein
MKTNKRRFGRFPKGKFRAASLEESLLIGDDETVCRLLEEGGDGVALRGHHLEPLLAAIQPTRKEKTDAVRHRLVGHLLGAGADPNASCGGITPLLLAGTHGDAAIVQALLDAGAEVETRDYQGRSALHRAAAANKPAELIRPLLQAGIDVDAGDLTGSSAPLDVYARHHNREACLALLAAGADPMVRLGRSDATTIDTARSDESPTLIQRLDLDFQIAAADFVERHQSRQDHRR